MNKERKREQISRGFFTRRYRMNPATNSPENGHSKQNTSQRALAAARQVKEFSPDAKRRRKAGTRAPDGIKGKSTAKAAAQFQVSTRAVEQGKAVLDKGIPELVRAVDEGRISVSTAVKLASKENSVQRTAVDDIAKGKPIAHALASAGIDGRLPASFDDKTLTRAWAQVWKTVNLRARAFGPNEAYRQVRFQLELAGRAMGRWRTEGLNEPAPLITDTNGRQVPLELGTAFQTGEEIEILCFQLDAIIKVVEGLMRQKGSELIQIQCILPGLLKARKILSDARPLFLCYCCAGHAQSCQTCRNRGWLPVHTWQSATP
jgi:hypothetical protein